MAHRYANNLRVNPPPMRNILIVYYSIKFRTVCPEKNGKSRPSCTGPEPCLRQVSGVIGGMTCHTFMVTGDIGEYEIALEKVAE